MFVSFQKKQMLIFPYYNHEYNGFVAREAVFLKYKFISRRQSERNYSRATKNVMSQETGLSWLHETFCVRRCFFKT